MKPPENLFSGYQFQICSTRIVIFITFCFFVVLVHALNLIQATCTDHRRFIEPSKLFVVFGPYARNSVKALGICEGQGINQLVEAQREGLPQSSLGIDPDVPRIFYFCFTNTICLSIVKKEFRQTPLAAEESPAVAIVEELGNSQPHVAIQELHLAVLAEGLQWL